MQFLLVYNIIMTTLHNQDFHLFSNLLGELYMYNNGAQALFTQY